MNGAQSAEKETTQGLRRYLSPLNVWALSFGCAVGWGAFVMPGTTFLPSAGPLGTAIGIAIGALVMLVIGANYHYLMNRYPDAGGTLTYSIRAFGYDHGFLSAWFLMLVYIAIIWANATAVVLIVRNLFGGVLQWGFHYAVAGYDVYLGEVLLTIGVIALFGYICMRSKRVAVGMQTVGAIVLFGGILVCAVAVLSSGAGLPSPDFSPNGKSTGSQIFNIIALAPWAFVGFESVSNSTQGFRFQPKKSLGIMALALAAGATAYILLALMAASVQPSGYQSWAHYISSLGSLSGLEGLPTFYATHTVMGRAGLLVLGIAVSAGIITGLVGNFIAGSRLMYAMTTDGILPEWFGRLDKNSNPSNALLFLTLISLPIPFLGRAAIGWIVDVNTIGATIAYAYTSAAALKAAREAGNGTIRFTGLLGLAVSLLFFLYFMVPNFWTVSALTTESYMILIAWSILGFVFFRYIFNRDTERRFGKSTVVWMILLFLIFFTSMLWVRQATHNTSETVLGNLNAYNTQELTEHGVTPTLLDTVESEAYLGEQMDLVNNSLTVNSLVQMALILIALLIMFNLYNSMMRREKDMEIQKVQAEQSNRAKSTFLSNMSHDIRTPMNAIIGYTNLAKKEPELPPKASEYLVKIGASSEHLLALINDVLEMSRIESGKMELDPVKSDLVKTLGEVRDLFITQMETKSLTYTVTAEEVQNRFVLCDTNRLNRVLLNLISNAYKFTPEGGSVTVTLKQTGATEDTGSYELRVRDTGMGMSPEFAAKVFEAYERERTANNIQGTGLGMAITKSIVDLMGGSIEVHTRQGEGTEFLIRVDFPLAEETPEDTAAAEGGAAEVDFTGTKLLLVEDNEINREIAELILQEAGFELDSAENGKIAVEKVAAMEKGEFQAVLMDIQMPVMDGYDAARAIRALPDAEKASIPIIAMTANAFAEDIQAAKDAGMDSHVAKPIDVGKLMETLAAVLRK